MRERAARLLERLVASLGTSLTEMCDMYKRRATLSHVSLRDVPRDVKRRSKRRPALSRISLRDVKPF